MKQMPQGHTILGKVMMAHIPYLEVMKKPASGWMEEDDEFSM